MFTVAIVAAICLIASPAAAQQNTTFTNCGQTGPTGPDQSQCDTAYSGTGLAGEVTVNGGIQEWTVSRAGLYRIEAWGAAGGTQTYNSGFPGGRGAYVNGTFNLAEGQTIRVLVGQMGGDTRVDTGTEDIDNAGPGGGGGTFVFLDANDPFPLLAAGGGGSGARCSSVSRSFQDGNAGMDGNRSGSLDNGGIGGNGGTSNVGGDSYWAGGGAGWLTDGTGGNNPIDYDYDTNDPNDPNNPYRGGEGGRTPLNGGLGGFRWIDDPNEDEGGDGGFGGGGGGGSDNMGGGGGGGFSGGGGGRNDPCENEPGGGSGSYNGGSSASSMSGVNAGHGYVVLSGAPGIPTLSEWGLVLLTLMLAAAGVVAARFS